MAVMGIKQALHHPRIEALLGFQVRVVLNTDRLPFRLRLLLELYLDAVYSLPVRARLLDPGLGGSRRNYELGMHRATSPSHFTLGMHRERAKCRRFKTPGV